VNLHRLLPPEFAQGNSIAYDIDASGNVVGLAQRPDGSTNAVLWRRTGGATLLAPASLSARTSSATKIALAWIDSSSNETGFRIERRVGAGSWVRIATVGTNVTSYANSALTPGTTYSYRVHAFNASGASGSSNVVTAKTPTLPKAPTNLLATAVSTSQINLKWTDTSTDETNFQIQRRIGTTGTWVAIRTVGPSVTTFLNTGLVNRTTYYYRIRAYKTAAGYSAYSNVVGATTR
jgi:hypothetical protein